MLLAAHFVSYSVMPLSDFQAWQHDRLHMRIFEARIVTMPAGRWYTPNVRSSFWRFYWNDEEGGYLDWGTAVVPLRANTPYFVPADVLFTCRNDAPFRHFYIHFDVLGLPSLMQKELFGAPLELEASQSLGHAVADLAPELAADKSGLMQICKLKMLLFDALGQALGSFPLALRDKYQRLTQADEVLLPALRAIDHDPGGQLDNVALAALCHLSPDHFIRRFREMLGQTPGAYVQERRVVSAAQMLLFTAHTLEHISTQNGFGNRFYFSRAFKRHFGIAPAAYRKTARPNL